ncbi:hypothetical protein AGMMS50212_15770 [Spirochaetia bacterium]|nr:hypothetical protein AGMMS50212_15770 [Spirochaetia bacterium]
MVFRLVCELNETVDRDVLQHALKMSLETSPFYNCVLRHGLFWYYLEKTDIQPEVREEFASPCAPLYDSNRKSLLFELTYYRKRINLEIYHVLADAIGAAAFFKTIVYHYLMEKNHGTIDKDVRIADDEYPVDQKAADAFDTYYSHGKTPKLPKAHKVYCMGGARFSESRFGIIEGHIPTSALLKKSHELNCTLSEMLVSILIWSIHEDMKLMDEKKPISIKIPVDLRKYYSSSTVRNFLGVFDAEHNFSKHGKKFEDVLNSVKSAFKTQLTPEKIAGQFNRYTAFEHSPYIKVVPLALKSLALKNVALLEKNKASATFSNIGAITMPKEMSSYIRLFSIFCSVNRLYLGVCSFSDITTISFTSPLINSSIQRSFFRTLSSFGIDVEIVSNIQGLQAEV